MDKISVKEYADIKGCSERYVRKLIASGALAYEIADNPQNKIRQYIIPVSALPEAEQARYYAAKGGPAVQGIAKIAAQPRMLEEYSAEEREQISMWSELLMDWQRYRNDPVHISKAGVDKAYVAMLSLTRPELRLSEPTLYRKWAAYKAGDLDGLVDKRGQWRKGKSDMPEELWNAFLWYYLDQRQYPIAKCVEYTEMWTREFHPELLDHIPSYHAFRRQVLAIEEPVRVLAREGEKAYTDRCLPYIDRLYDRLEANEYWIADNHTFDILTRSADGETVHRMYLTAFIDARSQIFTGWFVTDAPCSDATLMALRHGILRCGIPRSILVDNGREFLNYDVGGLGHRQKKSTRDLPTAPPIFQRLGIEMRNAIVRNAKAKPIERTFGDLKNFLSRLFETYTGGNVLEKPANLKDKANMSEVKHFEEAKEMSKFGRAYELLYIDENGHLKTAALPFNEVLPIYGNSVGRYLAAAIRRYDTTEFTGTKATRMQYVDVYTKTEIVSFRRAYGRGSLTFLNKKPHMFSDVPVIVRWNNTEQRGDYEDVIPQIDAYDRAQSDTANDLDYFSDAYLEVKGVEDIITGNGDGEGNPENSARLMKDQRMLFFPDANGGAQFITKNVQDTPAENYKSRLYNNLFFLSLVPNLTDESFSGNLSGVAIKYKLFGLEELATEKEKYFCSSELKKLRLMTEYINILRGTAYDWRTLKPTFDRSSIANTKEIAEIINYLRGLLSDETLIGMWPEIESAAAELKKRRAEKAAEENDDLPPDLAKVIAND